MTQAQYEQVMGTNPSEFKGLPPRPVEMVSWEDAAEFCRRLSQKEGAAYRLPTEAEWEYACRAGSATKYCFGDDDSALGDYAWYGHYFPDDEAVESTAHPVGQKKPNAWGLYDMHGNVWEWCADWFERGYYASSPSKDPAGPAAGVARVLQGGSSGQPGYLRSAVRSAVRPGDRGYGLGFRVARTCK